MMLCRFPYKDSDFNKKKTVLSYKKEKDRQLRFSVYCKTLFPIQLNKLLLMNNL